MRTDANMGGGSFTKLRARPERRPAGHCGFVSVPAWAAGGPIWIGGAVGTACARGTGRVGPGGRFCAAGAGAVPAWLAGSLGSLVMMLTGGMEAAEGKLIPLPTLAAGAGGGGGAATGGGGAAASGGG